MLGEARSIFTREKFSNVKCFKCSMKKRRGVGASCLFLLHYLCPYKFVSDIYPNKDKCDSLDGTVITWVQVIRVTGMDQLYIFMEHEYFGYHWLNLVHSWVRVIIECSQTHVFEDIEQNNQGGQVAVESYSCETPIHARTQEDIYDIMAQGYKINYDRLSAPKKNQSLQVIIDYQYIKMDVNGMAQTIGGQNYVNQIQLNLMV